MSDSKLTWNELAPDRVRDDARAKEKAEELADADVIEFMGVIRERLSRDWKPFAWRFPCVHLYPGSYRGQYFLERLKESCRGEGLVCVSRGFEVEITLSDERSSDLSLGMQVRAMPLREAIVEKIKGRDGNCFRNKTLLTLDKCLFPAEIGCALAILVWKELVEQKGFDRATTELVWDGFDLHQRVTYFSFRLGIPQAE